MRVLVTGGAGFIGSALCRHLVGDIGAEVLNLDKLTYAANLNSLASISRRANYRGLVADICDEAAVVEAFAAFKPEAVIHLAAESHVDRSISGSAAFIETNIVGTHRLLEAALRYWRAAPRAIKDSFRFLHVSTDEVFGSLGADGLLLRDDALRSKLAVLRKQSCVGSSRAGLAPHLWIADTDLELLQQLRSLPIS